MYIFVTGPFLGSSMSRVSIKFFSFFFSSENVIGSQPAYEQVMLVATQLVLLLFAIVCAALETAN